MPDHEINKWASEYKYPNEETKTAIKSPIKTTSFDKPPTPSKVSILGESLVASKPKDKYDWKCDDCGI